MDSHPGKRQLGHRNAAHIQRHARTQRFSPQQDAAVLTPLLARGAIVMGKTNLEELSVGWSSNNGEFGAVLNPYAMQHSPGGSSGGSAAVVAARIAPVSVGEDTFGSVRVPASMCGVAGFRPSFGRYPAAGMMAQTFEKLDQPAPLPRSVGDLVLFDQVVTDDFAPVVPADPRGIRVGLAPQFFLQRVDNEVELITLAAVDRLRAAGVAVVEIDLSEILSQALPTAVTLIAYEARPTRWARWPHRVVPAFLFGDDGGRRRTWLASQTVNDCESAGFTGPLRDGSDD